MSDSLFYQDQNGEIFFEFESREQKMRVPIEFSSRHKIGGQDDLLAKAIGLKIFRKKYSRPMKVLDLTAGLGRDAFHMAQLGCEVVSLERNGVLAEALQKVWERHKGEEKLSFVHAEAKDYLLRINDTDMPDVIYYDPMFPEKKKSALAGKESQLLQLLAGHGASPEEPEILNLALAKASLRVVVKRPPTAPVISVEPQMAIKGKAIRFDIYYGRGLTYQF